METVVKILNRELRILICEDVPADAELMLRQLRNEELAFSSRQVDTRDGFLEQLKNFSPDLILSDYSMPTFNGLQALKLAKQWNPSIPFIIVTGSINEETAVECIKAGADDYLIKEHLVRLGVAVRGALVAQNVREEKVIVEEERERLAMAIEHTAETVMVMDLDGTILYVNPACEVTTGFKKSEVVGQNAGDFQVEKQSDDSCRKLWETIRSGEIWAGQRRSKKKDGSSFEEAVTVSPVFDHRGDITYYVAVKRDVTKQMILEHRLRQAQKLEAIGTLAGGIAHDFNNVLAVIIGYGEMARDASLEDEKLKGDLDQVLTAANRAKELVAQILTFSRGGEEKEQEVQLDQVLAETLKFLQPSIPTTIQVHHFVDKECKPILANPTQMHQVIMNLCTNAFQAMKDCGGTLSIRLELEVVAGSAKINDPRLPAGSYVKLIVKDTGHGMDKEIMDRIFDPFFTTKGQGEGTGLGLATVHGIVTAHRGAIIVDSEPGQGTTFAVYLPCLDTGAEQLPPPVSAIRGGNEKILLVDDEPSLIALFKRQLEMAGYVVSAFTDSRQALKAFVDHPSHFDLIITDHTMPKLTSIKLIQQAREIQQNIPILMMTGSLNAVTQVQGEKLGLIGYIRKPEGTQNLIQHVREILDQSL